MMLGLIKYFVNLLRAKISPVKYARSIGVKVGDGVRIYSLHPGAFGSEPYLVSIGDEVTITAGVRFVTHDGSTFLFRKQYPDIDVMGPINVGDNTFIGSGSIVLAGVSIGDNCVIGAMSVVSSPVPAGSVAAGNPARVIGKTDSLLEKLLTRSCGTGDLGPAERRSKVKSLPLVQDKRGRYWVARDQPIIEPRE